MTISPSLPSLNFADVVVQRKAIKHLYFRVIAEGEVVISAPKRMPKKVIEQAFYDKYQWILRTQEKVRQREKKSADYRNEKGVLTHWQLWGKRYEVMQYESRKNHLILDEDNAIAHFYCRSKMTQEAQSRWLTSYYRQELMLAVGEYVQIYQPVLGVVANELRSKQMKTKWGTCNRADKRLWFNMQLAKYPKKCCEYVVVHELAHLLERYHNARFYGFVEQAMPDWKMWHDYLKNY